jgi:DNA polymerase III subunit epsilon
MHQGTTFTAIDFETANRDPDSACAIGLVRVEDGRIVRRAYRLIRPWTRRFEFTYLHGIAWRHVATARKFADVWPVIAGMCRGVDFVAAHNAAFDEGVLRACCARSGIAPGGLRFECTVQMARRELGIYPTGLAVVAERLGVTLEHHNAASDARRPTAPPAPEPPPSTCSLVPWLHPLNIGSLWKSRGDSGRGGAARSALR